MQYVSSNWQSVCSDAPGGNRVLGCWLPGYTTGSEGGSPSGGNTLAQTILTMKSPRKQNGQTVGSVRTGIPYVADIEETDALPRTPQQNLSETSSPREIPLPKKIPSVPSFIAGCPNTRPLRPFGTEYEVRLQTVRFDLCLLFPLPLSMLTLSKPVRRRIHRNRSGDFFVLSTKSIAVRLRFLVYSTFVIL